MTLAMYRAINYHLDKENHRNFTLDEVLKTSIHFHAKHPFSKELGTVFSKT